jgi:3-hydroxyacyl-[acyl-carrier-protein] dehydratase
VLNLHVETLRGGSKIWKFKGIADVNGQMAAEAEFTAMMDLSEQSI